VKERIKEKIADARIFNIHPFLEKRQVLDDT